MDTLINRLRTRAQIRRQISSRKSVQEGKPDRLSDLLDEAASHIQTLESEVLLLQLQLKDTKIKT